MEGSSRQVGVDSAGRTYFIGSDATGGTCLLVYPENGQWGSSCGVPGEFVLQLDGVFAWLSVERTDDLVATESLRDIVFLFGND